MTPSGVVAVSNVDSIRPAATSIVVLVPASRYKDAAHIPDGSGRFESVGMVRM